jgi:putative SOS response-associated peptidase YedK
MELPPRDIRSLDWGLILNEKDIKSTENRAITVHDNELSSVRFNPLLRFKRCLILADGLYFWKNAVDVPQYLVRSDRQPFALAGIREQFKSGENSFNTCAIISISPSESGESAQAMPALVRSADFDQWLSPMVTKIQRIAKLISPLPLDEMESRAVGDQVKDAADKLAHCIDSRQ